MPLPCLKILQWFPTLLGIKYNFLTTAFWAPGDLSPTQFSQYFSIFFILLSPLQTVFEIYVFFFFPFLFLKRQAQTCLSFSAFAILGGCPPPQQEGVQGIYYTRSTTAKRCLFLMHTKEPYELPAILPPCDDSFIPETSVSWAPTTS